MKTVEIRRSVHTKVIKLYFLWVGGEGGDDVSKIPGRGLSFFLKNGCFRVRVRVSVICNPNPNPKTAFFKKR